MTSRQIDLVAPSHAKAAAAPKTQPAEAESARTAGNDLLAELAPGTSAEPRPLVQAAALRRASGGRLDRAGDALLGLQRRYGNRHVQRVIEHARSAGAAAGHGVVPAVQAKLALGSADDRYEREADRAARQLGGQPMSRNLVDADGGQPMAWTDLEASISHVTSGAAGGEPLAEPVAKPMQEAFGVDFRQVRLHGDAASDALCRSISARAFTVGDHIFFRRGEDASSGASGRQLIAHELAHVVQQRGVAVRPGHADGPHIPPGAAPRATIQGFWVKTGGQYRWKADATKKGRYVRTTEKRRTFQYPMKRRVYVDPWATGTALQVQPIVFGFGEEETTSSLAAGAIAELKRIRRTDVGAELLGALATAMTGTTTVAPAAGMRAPVTETEKTAPTDPSVRFTPGEDLDFVEILAGAGIKVRAPRWNPTRGDVAVFHELVHAYHRVNGTTAPGQVTEEQAIHAADVGTGMFEYQAVGLDTRDGDRAHQYANDRFTENTYRARVGQPPRDTYLPEPEPEPEPEPVKKKTKSKAKRGTASTARGKTGKKQAARSSKGKERETKDRG